MKVLVTGGTGFLGRYVVRRLLDAGDVVRVLVRPSAQKDDVRIADPPDNRSGAEEFFGDLRDCSSLKRAVEGMETVCHCAAHVKGRGKWSEFEEANVRGTERLLKAACRERVKRFLHVSSLGIYWSNGEKIITEESPLDPSPNQRGCYTRSKIESEQLVWKYHRDHGLPVTVIRPGLLYSRECCPLVTPMSLSFGSRLRVALARPKQTLSLTQVDNVAEIIHRALRAKQAVGKVYNVVDDPIRLGEYLTFLRQFGPKKTRTILIPPGPFYPLLSFMEQVCHLIGLAPPLSRHQFERVLNSVIYDTSRAKEEIGWISKGFLAEVLTHVR
jgi:nucleoside-diphosphate-sugar epimerase